MSWGEKGTSIKLEKDRKMSRTREISGIVTRTSGIGDKAVYQFIENGQSQGIYEKATLIIELPERKVTISESEFFNKIYKYFHNCSEGTTYNGMANELKDEFFKDAE